MRRHSPSLPLRVINQENAEKIIKMLMNSEVIIKYNQIKDGDYSHYFEGVPIFYH